jgi:hypothetical protein
MIPRVLLRNFLPNLINFNEKYASKINMTIKDQTTYGATSRKIVNDTKRKRTWELDVHRIHPHSWLWVQNLFPNTDMYMWIQTFWDDTIMTIPVLSIQFGLIIRSLKPFLFTHQARHEQPADICCKYPHVPTNTSWKTYSCLELNIAKETDISTNICNRENK